MKRNKNQKRNFDNLQEQKNIMLEELDEFNKIFVKEDLEKQKNKKNKKLQKLRKSQQQKMENTIKLIQNEKNEKKRVI
ncbi:unnamed protein product [Paramecium sonneborni]|uniref:Uncharacterized protein n=1 Tax=Paramecium sonneborni TaxID=65129 RepID=A0A8S1NH08_9CILI|nr:unnamed protein product [Paramecium sonneborni]